MPLKFVIAGPGLIGRRHAALVAANPDCELIGLVGPSSEQNKAAAREFGAPLHPTLEAAATGAMDGVIIASPNTFHLEQATFCIERNIPVLVEKPLADTLEAAKTLRDLASAKNARVLVGHHRTYNPYIRAAKAFVDSADFGRPVMFQGAALFYKPDSYFDAGPWRSQPGGGPLLINMVHEIGVMRSLFGEIAEVFAFTGNGVRGFAVEDTASIALIFASGAFGSFVLSDAAASIKSWEQTTGENPAYPHADGQSCYHLAGTVGSLDFPTMTARSYGTDGERSWWCPQAESCLSTKTVDPLAAQIAHFVEVIHGLAEPMVSADDGYKNMLVLDAIIRSVRERIPITLVSGTLSRRASG